MTHPITFVLVITAASASAAAAMSGSLPLAAAFAVLALGLTQIWRLAPGRRQLNAARRQAQGQGAEGSTSAQVVRPARPRASFSTLVDGASPESTLTFLPKMRAGLTRSVVERPGD